MTNKVLDRMNVDQVNLAGWPHVQLTRKQFAELMLQDCKLNEAENFSHLPKLAFSMNGQALSLCSTSDEFKSAMMKADYIQADGQSLIIASRLIDSRNSLPERIATTDFFHDAAEVATANNLKFYFLGASEDMISAAVAEVRKTYPDLNVVGYRNGYFDIKDEEEICKAITESGADVLWVGMGKPKEQLFCIRNRERLKGVSWIKTCGGLFDFLCGRNKRAPQWMQDYGLEWAHRTLSDPKRFLWRYLTTNVHTILILWNGRNVRSHD